MIDLRLIETFVQSARRESFSDAARALGISPGAVSQNIKSLEEQLAVRLFVRTTRQVRLTPEGQRFLQRCAPALEALADATTELREDRAAFRGRLRITSTTAFGRAHVLPALVQFQQMYPELSVELNLSDGFVDLVADEFDLAIRAGILPDSDYVARLLLPVVPMVCATPSYLHANGMPKNLSALSLHRLIGMRANPTQKLFAWEFANEKQTRSKSGRQHTIERLVIAPVLIVNDPEALLIAALQGTGVAQIGSNIALPFVKAGQLTHILADRCIRSRGIYAVYPSKRFAPAKLTGFIDHLAMSLSERADLIF
jgi:DNA-binding transcriptional LysR family regulator